MVYPCCAIDINALIRAMLFSQQFSYPNVPNVLMLQISFGAETQTKLVDAMDALALYNQLQSHLKQFADQILNLLLKPLIVGGKKSDKQHFSLTSVEDTGDGESNLR